MAQSWLSKERVWILVSIEFIDALVYRQCVINGANDDQILFLQGGKMVFSLCFGLGDAR